MKKVLFVLAILCSTCISYAQQINDPNAEIREAKGFHAISVSSSFDVYLSQGNEESVAVSASDVKFREKIKVEVKEGTLVIRFDADGKFWNNSNKKLKAYISFKEINKLVISGACDVFINGSIRAKDLEIRQSGASDLKGKLDISGSLLVDLSGASDMLVSGKATQASIEVSGASDFKGFDLATELCNARASGASDIKITVNKELSVHTSGASDVLYKGTGMISDLKTSGASSVRKG